MKCWICGEEAVYYNPQNKKALCKKHFIDYFEKKVFKTIRQWNMIKENDTIAVALSGEKDSMVALNLVKKFTNKYGQKVFAITIDEGIYRKKAIEIAREHTEGLGIDYYVFSYKEEFGYTLPEILKYVDLPACRVCGILRRYLLNKKARELGATKLVTGHNLNDEAENILLNIFRGKIIENSKLGPVTGVNSHPKFVPKVKPLYFMRVEEIKLYAELNGIPFYSGKCPYLSSSFRFKIREFLKKTEKEYPGTIDKIVSGNLEVLPILKENNKGEIKTCKICGEPSSQEICSACRILSQLPK